MFPVPAPTTVITEVTIQISVSPVSGKMLNPRPVSDSEPELELV